jgi:hypothetical protein
VSAFITPTSPADAMPGLVSIAKKTNMVFKGKIRSYVQGRVYELRRRGLLEIVK